MLPLLASLRGIGVSNLPGYLAEGALARAAQLLLSDFTSKFTLVQMHSLNTPQVSRQALAELCRKRRINSNATCAASGPCAGEKLLWLQLLKAVLAVVRYFKTPGQR